MAQPETEAPTPKTLSEALSFTG